MSTIVSVQPGSIFEAFLADILDDSHRRVSRKVALERLAAIESDENNNIPTLNCIRGVYNHSFTLAFWELVGDRGKKLMASDLTPITLNPMFVMTGQETVKAEKVRSLLNAPKRKVFYPLVRGELSPDTPTILVQTPHGYITIDGNHRMRALQLLNVRRIQVHTIPTNHPLTKKVKQLFRKYGYSA